MGSSVDENVGLAVLGKSMGHVIGYSRDNESSGSSPRGAQESRGPPNHSYTDE